MCEIQWSYGPVTSILLPLDDVDYIPGADSGAIEHIVREGHLDLVMLPLVQDLLTQKWEAFAKGIFNRRFRMALVQSIMFTLMVVYNPLGVSSTDLACAKALRWGTHWLCRSILTYLTIRKLSVELTELCREGFARYFGKGAILFENCCSLSFVFIFLLSQSLEIYGSSIADSALAISALLSWFYLLWFLLGFSGTGHLVVMIWKIVIGDMVKFAQLTSIFLVGFSLAFFIINTTPTQRGPRLLLSHVLDCFHMMTAGFDKDANKDGFFFTLIVTYILLVTILLINILIAMMNDTYNKVSGMAEQEWRLERARIITSIEQELLRPPEGASKYWVEIAGQRYLQMQKENLAWARS